MARLEDTTTPTTATTRADTTEEPALSTTPTAHPGAVTDISRVTKLGMLCLPLSAVALGIAAFFMNRAVGATDLATDPDAFLAAVSSHGADWAVFGALMLVGALLTMAWVPAVWRLASSRTPKWAWAAAVLGALSAMGQFVHLMSWVVLSSAMADTLDPPAAVALGEAVDGNSLFIAIFAPYLIGFLLAAPAAAIAMRRAGLLPTWAPVLVALVGVAAFFLGNITMPMMAIYPLGLVAGFAPAVLRVLREHAV